MKGRKNYIFLFPCYYPLTHFLVTFYWFVSLPYSITLICWPWRLSWPAVGSCVPGTCWVCQHVQQNPPHLQRVPLLLQRLPLLLPRCPCACHSVFGWGVVAVHSHLNTQHLSLTPRQTHTLSLTITATLHLVGESQLYTVILYTASFIDTKTYTHSLTHHQPPPCIWWGRCSCTLSSYIHTLSLTINRHPAFGGGITAVRCHLIHSIFHWHQDKHTLSRSLSTATLHLIGASQLYMIILLHIFHWHQDIHTLPVTINCLFRMLWLPTDILLHTILLQTDLQTPPYPLSKLERTQTAVYI